MGAQRQRLNYQSARVSPLRIVSVSGHRLVALNMYDVSTGEADRDIMADTGPEARDEVLKRLICCRMWTPCLNPRYPRYGLHHTP